MKRAFIYFERIMHKSAAAYGLKKIHLLADDRSQIVVEARSLFVALADHYKIRHYVVAWILGKDKSTISYYSDKAKGLLESDLNFINAYAESIKAIDYDLQK